MKAMRTTNKNHPVYEYILNSIDGEGYGVTLITPEDKLRFVIDTFRSEYNWAIKRYGEYRAFTEWLQGLPSSFDIDYTNCDIIRLAQEWGSLPDEPTDSQVQRILDNWFNFIMVKFFQLCKRYKIS